MKNKNKLTRDKKWELRNKKKHPSDFDSWK